MSSLLLGLNARMRATSRTDHASPIIPSGEPILSGLRPSNSAPRIPQSPSLTASVGTASPTIDWTRPLPLWLSPEHAKHIVKGNLMTLSARPKTVEQSEWIAHQVVEHYRIVWNFVRVVHQKEDNGKAICNNSSCPKMSAGENRSYTWLNRNHEPVDLPANEYMSLMQRWISGKIDDNATFPTDPDGVSFAVHPEYSAPTAAHLFHQDPVEEWPGSRGGFPRRFAGTSQLIFRQIFRVYAHLYWNHFVDPFYHFSLEKQLNSCFSHFILTATTLDMLRPEELEPMQYLIDLWAADGTFPEGSRAYLCANVERGRHISTLGGRA
ncbi:Mob1/phocein [Metarhizium album ARSEF 1941]|uniref:Mob1/phocein n=1 Tax=Metarhizium album (strain ARSEF 1941) TaxID=1081103 RepID=A0A0B2X5G3_METAS|nr:Mob1/phocein [Metarhizium album ARSEF 1941]KHO00551.1 Mob1/phocein [Metarhizium album ARSEF 1941]